MSMPSYVYLVEVIDRTDFMRVVARKVCKTKRAADNWGLNKQQDFALASHCRCIDLIDFTYTTQAIEYLDN